MRYIAPSYNIEIVETEDILWISGIFNWTESTDEETGEKTGSVEVDFEDIIGG